MYKQFGKRFFDICGACCGLFIAAPVLVLAMVALALANGGKVFFPQERPGLGGRPFRILKFKTMTDEVDGRGELLPDEARLTYVGRIIRKTSLDEVLQLVNVLKGDMSLIGPRPLLVRYLSRYTPTQARRHEVRPGITGLAQVKGRNALDWRHRFRYDVFYVDHVSLSLDLQILLWTVKTVLGGKGVEFSKDVSWEFLGRDPRSGHSKAG
ncbi:MAG: sugar transferase [Bdellovibrionales bacterium]|nr:sugar transferase [Bdellovibrionales bacterium]